VEDEPDHGRSVGYEHLVMVPACRGCQRLGPDQGPSTLFRICLEVKSVGEAASGRGPVMEIEPDQAMLGQVGERHQHDPLHVGVVVAVDNVRTTVRPVP